MAVLLSRIAGLVRERFFAAYLGTTDSADAFRAAMRIPTIIQDLLGDRVVSASFIPEYSRVLAGDSEKAARRVALALGGIQALLVTVLVVAGVLLAAPLVALIAPGFSTDKAELTVRLVRILFPASGLLVVGAWCLGVLNSHRKFFLPFAVPILSAVAVTVGLIWSGRRFDEGGIAEAAAWGALVGAALQVLVQLPTTVRLARQQQPSDGDVRGSLARIGRNALPGMGRGLAFRLSNWVEIVIAGFISTGALAALGYSQLLNALPGSLFTIAIAAAILPEMSADRADPDAAGDALRQKLDTAMRHTAYLMIPSAVVFMALGDIVAAAVYQSGVFTRDDALYVWAILAATSIGLLGTSLAVILATAFYALGDAVTPLKASLVRVAVRVGLGVTLAIPVARALGLPQQWSAAGLGAAIGISGWVEFVLLRRLLDRRVARLPRLGGYLARLWSLALVAAGVGWGIKWLGRDIGSPILTAILVLGAYGAVYLGSTLAVGVPEARSIWSEVRSGLVRADPT